MQDLLSIKLSKRFKYQAVFTLSAIMHITFFILFTLNELYVLTIVNVFSIAMYIAGVIASIKSDMEKYGIRWLVAAYIEITFHAVLCTIWIGFESCFYLYEIIVLTVCVYFLYLICEKSKFIKFLKGFITTTLCSLVGCFLYFMCFDSASYMLFETRVPEDTIVIMRCINIIYDTVVTILFSILFLNEINVLIEKLNITNEKLNYSATHDTLTGLYNRRNLYEVYSQMKNDKNFCVVMGDIDNFKKINDTYGHGCGDEVLKVVSHTISDGMTEEEIACRWGGEEFLMVMVGTREECLERVQRIRENIISKNIEYNRDVINITMTFGFTECSEKPEEVKGLQSSLNIDALIQISDSRLYYGKNNGKNRIVDCDVGSSI